MGYVENVLLMLDEPPYDAAWRMAFGFLALACFDAIAGNRDHVTIYVLLFLALLMTLRVVPAVLRALLPFSAEARAIWKKRRFIAKDYDSYQWQKLFWIGVGMLLHALLDDRLGTGGRVLAAVCILGGGAGQLLWHKIAAHKITAHKAANAT